MDCEIRISGDNREHIVEVVGQSACKPPDCFHFLQLKKLGLQMFSFGHIAGDGGFADNRSAGIADWRRGQRNVDLRAVFSDPNSFSMTDALATGDVL